MPMPNAALKARWRDLDWIRRSASASWSVRSWETRPASRSTSSFEDGKASYEHINRDQANLLVQRGLIDPTDLPLTGAGAAAKLRDPSRPDPFFNES